MKTQTAIVALLFTGVLAGGVTGHYVLEGVHEVGSELLLKPDGTFEYMLAYGAADYSTTGKWRSAGGAVVLNSTVESGPPFRMTRGATVKTGGLCVRVKGLNSQPVPYIEVVIDTPEGKAKQQTDDQGAACFPEVKSASAVTMGVRVYELEAGPYPLNTAQNDFTFEINGAAITTVPFKDERLKINGTGLELRFWDKSKVMNYRKQ